VRTVIGDLLPLALVVVVSPINVVAAILLLFSKRPIANATAYLLGFLFGVAAMLAGITALADVIGLSPGSERSRGASVLLLALGALLVVAGVRKISHGPGPEETPDQPRWTKGITDFGQGGRSSSEHQSVPSARRTSPWRSRLPWSWLRPSCRLDSRLE
jgi:hypothetical protein